MDAQRPVNTSLRGEQQGQYDTKQLHHNVVNAATWSVGYAHVGDLVDMQRVIAEGALRPVVLQTKRACGAHSAAKGCVIVTCCTTIAPSMPAQRPWQPSIVSRLLCANECVRVSQ